MSKKPDTSGLVITIGEDHYVYDQVVIVSRFAPLTEIKLSDIKFNRDAPPLFGVPEIDDGVVRVCRRRNGAFILTGCGTVLKAVAEDQKKIAVQMDLTTAVERCTAPPKVLNVEELRTSLTTALCSKFHVKVSKAKQTEAVPPPAPSVKAVAKKHHHHKPQQKTNAPKPAPGGPKGKPARGMNSAIGHIDEAGFINVPDKKVVNGIQPKHGQQPQQQKKKHHNGHQAKANGQQVKPPHQHKPNPTQQAKPKVPDDKKPDVIEQIVAVVPREPKVRFVKRPATVVRAVQAQPVESATSK